MDSHVHIDFFTSERREKCLRDARAVGIDYFVVPGVSRDRWAQLPTVAHLENVFFALGEHPLELASGENDESRTKILSRVVQTMKNTPVGCKLVAIGEVGLDYYHLKARDSERKELQRQALREQLLVAKEKELPVIIHCRDKDGAIDAWNDVNLNIEECGVQFENVLFHSFSYGPEQAKKWCRRGGYVSFSGTVTKPNAGEIRAALPFIPAGQMLLETDAPFLLPQALRVEGKEQPMNEPKNLVEVARVVGGFLGKSVEKILFQTQENGLRFFRIKRQ
ncbi:MAG: TatD family hydrolase [Puniceicoccales bacterium]|jgi:TatD DNase family protein|nr:TatD family hydrolase [Puniceicoccales bacterium]